MADKAQINPEELAVGLNLRLEKFVATLDADNYPDSLLNALTMLLTVRNTRHACVIAVAELSIENGRKIDYEEMVALEIILTGLLLTVDFATIDESINADTPAARLVSRYGDALVLLTADTLLTLPYEYLERIPDEAGSKTTASSIANAVVKFLGQIKECSGLEPPGLMVSLLASSGMDTETVDSATVNFIEQYEYAEWFEKALPQPDNVSSASMHLTAVLEYLKV